MKNAGMVEKAEVPAVGDDPGATGGTRGSWEAVGK